jgi:ATP-binding protein involved in chromosome partitioning
MVSDVSTLGDQGKLGEIFFGDGLIKSNPGLKEVRTVMESVAISTWRQLGR